MVKKSEYDIANIFVPVLYGLLAVCIALVVCWSGQYPFGSDTMNHIYRGDVIYKSIADGNLFPLYDPGWYNGVEFIRHISIIPGYFMALCQKIAGGNPVDGYLVYVGLVFFIGAIIWYTVGKRKGRVKLGMFIGILWFFIPNNLFVMFLEGNLARSMSMVLLPLYMSYFYDYICDRNHKDLKKMMASFVLISMCDIEYMVIIAIASVLMVVVYVIMNRQWRKVLEVISALTLSVGIAGIWTIPALSAMSVDGNIEVMSKYFQSIVKTLNPIERFNTLNEFYYFGLAIAIVAVFGFLCSRRQIMSGFFVVIILCISTANSMYYVMNLVPGREFLLMCQYISIAVCIGLYCIILWDTLRKPILYLLCLLLVADVIPSINLITGTLSGISVEERFDEMNETTLIKEAKEITKQRMILLDGNELESMGAYLVADYENGVNATSGGYWEAAPVKTNIMQLNKALNNGFYQYLFDRCLELGNDTILIKVSQINKYEAPEELLDEAAKKSGYELTSSNEFYRLYHLDTEESWGIRSSYKAIAIGTNAGSIALGFPAFREVSSTNLNDYTYEELSQYETVYLAGFTYTDKAAAEEMIIKLSEAGVKIIIQADGIPEDRESRTKDFLGVLCNDIEFSNGYPLLQTKMGTLDCDLFPQGYEEWKTVYVNGLDEVWGTLHEEDMELDFYGTVKNDNIVVIGLNLTYYYSITRNDEIGELLSDITRYNPEILPDREIVPISVEYVGNEIKIKSDTDGVNTSLAYHKMFNNEDDIIQENNLLYVNEGTTTIKMSFQYFYAGLAVTGISIVLTIVFFKSLRKR